MKGVNFIVDENNQKTAVLIDLNQDRELWKIIESYLSTHSKAIQTNQSVQLLASPPGFVWEIWQRQADALSEQILQRRSHQLIDVDHLWALSRQDLEDKHDDCFSN